MRKNYKWKQQDLEKILTFQQNNIKVKDIAQIMKVSQNAIRKAIHRYSKNFHKYHGEQLIDSMYIISIQQFIQEAKKLDINITYCFDNNHELNIEQTYHCLKLFNQYRLRNNKQKITIDFAQYL